MTEVENGPLESCVLCEAFKSLLQFQFLKQSVDGWVKRVQQRDTLFESRARHYGFQLWDTKSAISLIAVQ